MYCQQHVWTDLGYLQAFRRQAQWQHTTVVFHIYWASKLYWKCDNVYNTTALVTVKTASYWVRSLHYEKRLLAVSCLSVCPSVRLSMRVTLSVCLSAWNRLHTQKNFHEIDIWGLLENLSRKLKYNLMMMMVMMMITITTDTSHKHPCTLLAIARSLLLITKNVSGKSSKHNHFVFSVLSCPVSQNAVQYGTDRQTDSPRTAI